MALRILGKMASSIASSRIQSESKKAGLLGAAAGMLASRLITRSPGGALLVGGAYIAHKIWHKKRQIDEKGPHQVAIEDGFAEAGSPAPPRSPRASYRKAKPADTPAAPEVSAPIKPKRRSARP